jgi:hypothetical protein
MPRSSIIELIDTALSRGRTQLGRPGDWLSGRQRVDVWSEVRKSRSDPLDIARRASLSPWATDGEHRASGSLNGTMVEVVHRVATDPGRLTRRWADDQIGRIGEETYTELVGLTAMATLLDTAGSALGRARTALPEPQAGEPSRIRPDGVGDVGAWVSQELEKTRANVSRTLSLVPQTLGTWRMLINDLYSRDDEFFDLAWDRALSRPQVELLAARTTVLSECFY